MSFIKKNDKSETTTFDTWPSSYKVFEGVEEILSSADKLLQDIGSSTNIPGYSVSTITKKVSTSMSGDNAALTPKTTMNKSTGERVQHISVEVPGLSAKDVKVTWNKDARVLTLTGKSSDYNKTYEYRISTFSYDLLEDTLSTTVENGIATVSGKLRDIKSKEEEKTKTSSEVEVPVK